MFKLVVKLSVFFTLMLVSTYGYSKKNSCLNIHIPIMEEASKIKQEENKFLMASLKYSVNLRSLDDVYYFYEDYFEENGFKNSAKRYENRSEYRNHDFNENKTWSSFALMSDESGFAVAKYGSLWEKEGMPVIATVRITVDSFRKNIFSVLVEVNIGPVSSSSRLMKIELHNLLKNNPDYIYRIQQLTNVGIKELDKLDDRFLLRQYDDPIVNKYFELVEKIQKNKEKINYCNNSN